MRTPVSMRVGLAAEFTSLHSTPYVLRAARLDRADVRLLDALAPMSERFFQI